jgi:hypothetical protein
LEYIFGQNIPNTGKINREEGDFMRKQILYFMISALIAAALLMSGCEQTAGAGNGNDPPPVEVPAAPEKPELLADDGSLIVIWKKVAGAESYGVYYGTNILVTKAQKWGGELTEGTDTCSTVITGLENEKRYYVWVTASNVAGESGYSEEAYAKPLASSFELPSLFFDYGRKIASYDDPEAPGTYTVPLGRTLVLTPVTGWKKSDAAVYEWKLDGLIQTGPAVHGTGGEYFSFVPSDQGEYTVQVKVTDGNNDGEAVTKVNCAASEGTYKRPKTAASAGKVTECFDFMPAPGQFVRITDGTTASLTALAQTTVTGAGVGWCFSLGRFGGYLITGFDHSVNNVTGQDSFSIAGNAFAGWGEPGVVWVSQDENGNGQADDTWYELRGSQTGQAGTIQRYAVSYFRPQTGNSGIWKDNQGIRGSFNEAEYPYLKDMYHFTVVGTKISSELDPDATGAWGYVDSMGQGRFKISDAMQVDGSPANLSYIDFVKVHTGANEMAGVFGEISTETGVPFDLDMPNPDLLIQGAAVGNGQYTYRFVNTSGYALTVTVEGETFGLSTSGGEKTITLSSAQVYFNYYGGNVTYTRATGLVTFSM